MKSLVKNKFYVDHLLVKYDYNTRRKLPNEVMKRCTYFTTKPMKWVTLDVNVKCNYISHARCTPDVPESHICPR